MARSGRRSAALAHFESYSRLLNAELGISPGAGTMALLDAIQSGEGARSCLLYTSDAADERSSVDLGGRRIIKKKKNEEREGSK